MESSWNLVDSGIELLKILVSEFCYLHVTFKHQIGWYVYIVPQHFMKIRWQIIHLIISQITNFTTCNVCLIEVVIKKFDYVQFYYDNPFIPNLCIIFRPHSYDEPQIDIFPLSHSIYRSESKDCVPIITKFQRFSSILFLESALFCISI